MTNRRVALAVLLGLAAAPVLAGPLGTTGTDTTSPDGVAYTKYTGLVRTFDDVPLDCDLTVPQGPIVPRPLVVMLHGWGGSKTDWESDTIASANADADHYNNVALVARGYAVLNYTARGFHGSCGPGAPADPACTHGWTHLADRRFEVRDTHHLVGLLVDAGVADARHVGVTGGSYGGGQSWLLALEADRVSVASAADVEQVTLVPWTSPAGVPIHLAVAIPKYPWSDLAHALMPNGRAADGVILADGNRLDPIGIMKQSYVSGLFALGATSAQYAPPGVDPTADLVTQYAAIQAGEPYSSANPVLANSLHQVTTWKSPFYQDALLKADVARRDEVPVLDVQGWTDALFPEVEGIAMVNKVRAADRRWPLAVWIADVGHSIAQNKASDWGPINTLANAFLDHYLAGIGPNPTGAFRTRLTTCDASVGPVFTASAWPNVAKRRLVLTSASVQTTTSAPTDQPAGVATDPIAQGAGCIMRAAGDPDLPGAAAWTFPVARDAVLLGEPIVTTPATLTGAEGEVDGRLWDVAPDGSRTLVTRGGYRVAAGGPTTIRLALDGNGWRFARGHTIRLELTQNDAPYLRIENLPSTISYAGVRLDLPTR